LTTTGRPTTHERYLHAVGDLVITRATERATITADQAKRLTHTKLLYGVGDGTYRGMTVFDAWGNGVGRVDVVEIAATGQESWIQLAGTVIHELGHVLAGMAAGHSNMWKDAAVARGFRKRPAAAGQVYYLAMIDPTIRHAVHDLAAGSATGEFRTHARSPPWPLCRGLVRPGSAPGAARAQDLGCRLGSGEDSKRPCQRPISHRCQGLPMVGNEARALLTDDTRRLGGGNSAKWKS
jgi:hypothetical protein